MQNLKINLRRNYIKIYSNSILTIKYSTEKILETDSIYCRISRGIAWSTPNVI